jgi:hypothetical protein
MAIKDMGFGKSDKDLAKTFGISVSDLKKIKKQITSQVTKPEIKEVMPKPKAGMTLKDLEKKIRTKPKTTKPEKYENTRPAKAKTDKMKTKIMKDFGYK